MPDQNRAPQAPKFGSFKPKFTEASPQTALPSSHTSDSASKGHRHHHRKRSRSEERYISKGDKLDLISVSSKTESSKEPDVFFIDRQGDKNNLVYESIHRYSVPAFHRIGGGNVLGVEKWLKIDRDVKDEKVIIMSRWRGGAGKREKYVFEKNEKTATRLLRIRPEMVLDTSTLGRYDFVPLKARQKVKRNTADGSDDESDNGKDHYRSIEGKAKAKSAPLDDTLEYVTDSSMSDSEQGRTIRYNDVLRQKTIELSRNVKLHPESTRAWIDLIDHQDTLLDQTSSYRQKITAAEKRSTADIKLHLYEEALGKAKLTPGDEERLLVGLMAEGSKGWDIKTQSERWERIIQDHLESLPLCGAYLNFRQSEFSSFRCDEMKAMLKNRIDVLRRAVQPVETRTPTRKLFEVLIYIVLRASLFMRESGYPELALAIWQALIEFNVFSPEIAKEGNSRLLSFQEFWDSEVPRLGEKGARGWKNFNADSEAPDGKTDAEIPLENLESSNFFARWSSTEAFRDIASREPARTMDDVTEDDPYRVILWSDIEPFIIDVTFSNDVKQLKSLLIDAFLISCRLPPCFSTEISRDWWQESFIRGELLECDEILLNIPSIAGDGYSEEVAGERIDQNLNPFQHFLPSNFVVNTQTFFQAPHWQNSFTPLLKLYGGDKGPVSYSWLMDSLKDLTFQLQDEKLAEYYLYLVWSNEPESVKKMAKGLLKQFSQSLRLYNAYASIEGLRGNLDAAVNVIVAALGMISSLPEPEQKSSIILWRSWTWLLLERGEREKALKCLYSIVGEGTDIDQAEFSPGILLKTRQHLQSIRDYLLSSDSLDLATIYTECLALEAYLAQAPSRNGSSLGQGDIASALKLYENYSSMLVSRGYEYSIEHELSHQSSASLLMYHIRHGPFRPALVREQLGKSLALFPQNTLFLTLYAANESNLRVDARVRKILRDSILAPKNDNLVDRLFSIDHEMRNGNLHSVRAAFENATASPVCSSSAGLWRWYILFCAKHFPRLAKDIFHRAIRACPWAKRIYMMAFRELKGLMSFDELRSAYRILGEKELRVHVDLQEELEEWDAKHSSRGLSRR